MAFPILAAVGAVQALTGFMKGDKAAAEAKRLRASRTPFKTNQEVYDIVGATENRATQGYDASTLDYLTNGIQKAATGAYGTAKRLGGNANDLSAIFEQNIASIMKVGANSAALQMENFSKYLGAKELLDKNLTAEWASQQGLIKDDLQAADKARQEAAAQVSGGINTAISAFSSQKIEQLYKERTDAIAGAGAGVAGALPESQPYYPEVISSSSLKATASGISPDAIQSVSGMATPNINFTGMRIMGWDENNQPIYRR